MLVKFGVFFFCSFSQTVSLDTDKFHHFNHVLNAVSLNYTRILTSMVLSPVAQSVAFADLTWEQEVAGWILGSANILSEDWW